MWFCINGKKATDATCQNCPKFFIDYENDFGHKNIMFANVCTTAGNEKGKTKTETLLKIEMATQLQEHVKL